MLSNSIRSKKQFNNETSILPEVVWDKKIRARCRDILWILVNNLTLACGLFVSLLPTWAEKPDCIWRRPDVSRKNSRKHVSPSWPSSLWQKLAQGYLQPVHPTRSSGLCHILRKQNLSSFLWRLKLLKSILCVSNKKH